VNRCRAPWERPFSSTAPATSEYHAATAVTKNQIKKKQKMLTLRVFKSRCNQVLCFLGGLQNSNELDFDKGQPVALKRVYVRKDATLFCFQSNSAILPSCSQ